jgi:hypothetical protein
MTPFEGIRGADRHVLTYKIVALAFSQRYPTWRIQGSHKSSARSAINPAMNSSPKSNCARCVLITRTPETISLLAQLLLIAIADLLQNLAHPIQVGDLTAHLVNLIGVKRNLAGFSAWIIYVQDPLVMAFAAGAGCAGDPGGMKEQGAAE